MALTYDQLSAITAKYFIPKLQDNVFDSNPVFKRLAGKKESPGGKSSSGN